MDEFEAKIQLLIEIVSEKNKKLTQVLNITTNQETLIKMQDPPPEVSALITDMSKEKQSIIDTVLDGDEVFNKIFEGLDEFEERAKDHRETVRALQAVVKIAADLDIGIRVAEEKNKSIIHSKSKEQRTVTRSNKQNLINKYKVNYKKEQ